MSAWSNEFVQYLRLLDVIDRVARSTVDMTAEHIAELALYFIEAHAAGVADNVRMSYFSRGKWPAKVPVALVRERALALLDEPDADTLALIETTWTSTRDYYVRYNAIYREQYGDERYRHPDSQIVMFGARSVAQQVVRQQFVALRKELKL